MKKSIAIVCGLQFLIGVTVFWTVEPAAAANLNPPQRSVRAPSGADAFNVKADQIVMISRVLAAINLQNGLLDDSISGDEAIAEMMNIGSVKLNDVENFDKSKVDKFLANLNETGNMDDSTGVLERGISLMQVSAALWGKVGGLDKLDDAAFQQFQTLNPLNLTMGKTDVEPTLRYLRNISNLPDDVATNTTSFALVVLFLPEFKKEISKVEEIFEYLKTLQTRLSPQIAWKSIAELSQTFQSLSLFLEAAEKSNDGLLDSFKAVEEKVKNAFVKNIERVEVIIADSGAEFEVMKSISSRFKPQLKQTTGFANGFLDLKQALNDSKSSWLLETLNTTLPLENGMTQLGLLAGNAASLETTWLSASNRSLLISLLRAIQLQSTAKQFVGLSGKTKSSIESFKTCSEQRSYYDASLLGSAVKNGEFLRTTLQALNAMFELVTDDHVQNVATFKNSTEITAFDQKTVSNMVVTMKQFAGTQKLNGLLESLSPHLGSVRRVSTFQDLTNSIESKKDDIINFNKTQKIIDKIKYFDCLRTSENDINGFANVVDLLKTLRNGSGFPELIGEIQKISTSISTSLPDVKTIRLFPEMLKSNQTDEMKELMKLSSLKDQAKSLSAAVFGVVAIQKAMQKTVSFQSLVAGLQAVDAAIEAVGNAKVKENIKKAWGDSAGLRKDVQDMLNELDAKTSSAVRAKRATSSLMDYEKFLTSLTGMKDVNVSAYQRLDALDALVAADPTAQSQVDGVQRALEDIGTLDLNFSSYSQALSGTPTSLTSIKSVFASLVPVSGGAGGQPSGQPSGQPNVQTSAPLPATNLTTTSADSSWGWVQYLICFLVIVFFIGFLTFLTFYVKRKMEEKKTKNSKTGADDSGSGKEESTVGTEKGTEKLTRATDSTSEGNEKFEKWKHDQDEELRKKEENMLLKVKKERDEAMEKIKMDDEKAKERLRKEEEDAKQKIEKAQEKLKEHEEEANQRLEKEAKKLEKAAKEAKKGEKKADAKLKDAKEKQLAVERDRKAVKEDAESLKRRKGELEQQRPVSIVDGKGVLGIVNLDVLKHVFSRLEFIIKVNEQKTDKEQTFIDFHFDSIWKKRPALSKATVDVIPVKRSDLVRLQFGRVPRHKCIDVSAVRLVGHREPIIHANWIRFPLFGRAILTQTPMSPVGKSPGTVEDFLFMIWQEDVDTIVMICCPNETIVSAGKYFEEEREGVLTVGSFTVTTVETEDTVPGELTTRTFQLKNTGEEDVEKQTRTLKQLHVKNWPSETGPISQVSQDVVKRVHLETRRKVKPIVVHCEDGSTRSGSFVAIEYLHQKVLQRGVLASLEEVVADLTAMRDLAMKRGQNLLFVQNMALQLMIDEVEAEELRPGMEKQWNNYNHYSDLEYDFNGLAAYIRNKMNKR